MKRAITGNHPDLGRERRMLRNWLAEWRIEKVLRVSKSADDPGWEAVSDAAPISAAPHPEPGQIWLLPPCNDGGVDERPLYVLVAQSVTSATFLVVPFGAFGSPATPGEWQTGLDAMPLRVLCFWNARVMARTALSRGWFCVCIPKRVYSRAVEALSHVRTGSGPGKVSPGALGPRLRHPLDPRHLYLAEEATLFKRHIDALGVSQETLRTESPGAFCYRLDSVPLRLAAESRAKYGVKRKGRGGRGKKRH